MSGQRKAEGSASVVVPGNHDGVHRGHQALLERARTMAKRHALKVVALTFDPHPAALLAPERAPTPLTTIARRVELLRRAGAEDVVVQRFDRDFASQPPEAFLAQLHERGARGIVVGPDFRFGKDRAGDHALLERFARAHDMDVAVEPPISVEGERVSSSTVRSAIGAGDVAHASGLLGHVHEMTGEVVRGDRRGHRLGFPTANLLCEPVLHPPDGVYAVIARPLGEGVGTEPDRIGHDSDIHLGVANLGSRPTFAAGRSVEVHLFDFSDELYGRRLRVGFVARIRGEERFSGPDALKAQIEVDCQRGRALLNDGDRGLWTWI